MERVRMSTGEKAELWRRWRRGESLSDIGRALGRIRRTVHHVVAAHGGVPPRARTRSRSALTLAEREEISRGLANDCSLRRIAGRLGRAPSTVSLLSHVSATIDASIRAVHVHEHVGGNHGVIQSGIKHRHAVLIHHLHRNLVQLRVPARSRLSMHAIESPVVDLHYQILSRSLHAQGRNADLDHQLASMATLVEVEHPAHVFSRHRMMGALGEVYQVVGKGLGELRVEEDLLIVRPAPTESSSLNFRGAQHVDRRAAPRLATGMSQIQHDPRLSGFREGVPVDANSCAGGELGQNVVVPQMHPVVARRRRFFGLQEAGTITALGTPGVPGWRWSSSTVGISRMSQ